MIPVINKGTSVTKLKPCSYLARKGEFGQHVFVRAFLQMCVYTSQCLHTQTHMAAAIKPDEYFKGKFPNVSRSLLKAGCKQNHICLLCMAWDQYGSVCTRMCKRCCVLVCAFNKMTMRSV